MPFHTLKLSVAGENLYADGLSNLVRLVNGITRWEPIFPLVTVLLRMRGYKLAVSTLRDSEAIELTAATFGR